MELADDTTAESYADVLFLVTSPSDRPLPAILHARDYDRWLDREETERPPFDLVRAPYESDEMEVYEVNPKVGNVRNNGPEMMRAAAKAAEDGKLPL